jgi:hypothetical protein
MHHDGVWGRPSISMDVASGLIPVSQMDVREDIHPTFPSFDDVQFKAFIEKGNNVQ